MMNLLFSVQAVPAYNSNHPFGQGNGYVVTIDEKRIYISGDTGAQPELRALEDIDIAFVCMNTPFTMTPADAASLVRDIEPLVVYPYHYRNQDGTTGQRDHVQESDEHGLRHRSAAARSGTERDS